MDSRITVFDGEGREKIATASNLDILADKIVSLSHGYDIQNVKVHAPLNIFYELQNILMSNYENNNLNLETI